ncbi:hypothetical protein GON26_12255 [Flavobacterium sp. GA093]|uniref:Uncharacterized protein n=1 Tax=Flavobacterium hydrocarbonoxydans TaxID=2683249 RepID=A0A6I4NRM5_9FLAO|nr:hypothetical protein [Flavobacterium hydrocarbonoxydans]MWB95135.1 hypothetical protein [Flavobacterium hydrocarbonoxydans]
MKTLEKITFPELENEYLENILRELINKYNIIQLFFTRDSSSAFSNLIVNLDSSMDVQKLQQSKWVRKVKENFQITVYFIFSSKLHHYYSLGDPFIGFYCRQSAIIYENKEFDNSIFTQWEWKKYKKRFNDYENNFYHDHELHKWQIKNLISESASNAIFTSYSRLIEYDLQYLEELYLGSKSVSVSINERITSLSAYIPAIQRYFVKSSKGRYFLTDLFEQAKEASSDDEALYRNEMFKAVGEAEENLCDLIGDRLSELKKLIKKEYTDKKEVLCEIDNKPAITVLDTAVQIILQRAEPEQIYLFHETTSNDKIIYYLLLIAENAGNEKLKAITNCLKNKIGGKCNLVMISHSRYWIQNNLYEHQSFFEKVIKENYLIYSSNEYHPEFHWEEPHKPYYGDLHIFYKSLEKCAEQFSATARNNEENYCGLGCLFAQFFLSFCRTYIFVKTYYMPNYLSSKTLWNLCIYADNDIKKYNYLLETFWTEIFPYLDANRTVSHGLTRLDAEKVSQMEMIVTKLSNELHKLVIEGGLLKIYEQD